MTFKTSDFVEGPCEKRKNITMNEYNSFPMA